MAKKKLALIEANLIRQTRLSCYWTLARMGEEMGGITAEAVRQMEAGLIKIDDARIREIALSSDPVVAGLGLRLFVQRNGLVIERIRDEAQA